MSLRFNNNKPWFDAHKQEYLELLQTPFRALAKMTLGGVSEAMAEDILLMVNGHFFQGAGRLIRDHFRHQKDDKAFVQTLEVP